MFTDTYWSTSFYPYAIPNSNTNTSCRYPLKLPLCSSRRFEAPSFCPSLFLLAPALVWPRSGIVGWERLRRLWCAVCGPCSQLSVETPAISCFLWTMIYKNNNRGQTIEPWDTLTIVLNILNVTCYYKVNIFWLHHNDLGTLKVWVQNNTRINFYKVLPNTHHLSANIPLYLLISLKRLRSRRISSLEWMVSIFGALLDLT